MLPPGAMADMTSYPYIPLGHRLVSLFFEEFRCGLKKIMNKSTVNGIFSSEAVALRDLEPG